MSYRSESASAKAQSWAGGILPTLAWKTLGGFLSFFRVCEYLFLVMVMSTGGQDYSTFLLR
jgi:hypothetical protein